MRPFYGFFLVLYSFFCLTNPALAQALDIKGQALKALLQSRIDLQKNTVLQNGGTLEQQGQLLVEKAETYYAATLPEFIYRTPTGRSIRFGSLAINAIPEGNTDWKMSLAFPTPLIVNDDKGQEVAVINIGSQKANGLWSEDLNGFSKFNATFSQITIHDKIDNSTISLDSLSTQTDLTRQEKTENWNGIIKIALRNIVATDKSDNKIFAKIGEIANINEIKKFDPEKIRSLQQEALDGQALSLFDTIIAQGDILSRFSVKNIVLREPQTNILHSMDDLSLSFKNIITDENTPVQSLALAYKNLKTVSHDQIGILIPENMDVSFEMVNFPLQNMIEFGQTFTAQANSENPMVKKLAATQAMLTVPQKLAEAGTKIMIHKAIFHTKDYAVNAHGEVKADPQSTFGGIGQFFLGIRNLDFVLNTLQPLQDSQTLYAHLVKFKEISKKNGDENSAEFILDKEGKFTINGTPLMSGQ